MAHEIHDYKATAAKLWQLALLRIAQGFDRLAKHAEEWPAAPSEE
jgi:hypothetical protein